LRGLPLLPVGDSASPAQEPTYSRWRDDTPVEQCACCGAAINNPDRIDLTVPRDVVLNWFPDPLPVAIRCRVSRHWSVERGAGMVAGLNGGTWRFGGPGRSVFVDVLTDQQRRSPAEFLHGLLKVAPDVPPEQTLTTPTADGITHAFWADTVVDSRPQRDFYAHVVRQGTALSIGAFFTDPDDQKWALHVLRSVSHHG
jgi:hypothetical protein